MAAFIKRSDEAFRARLRWMSREIRKESRGHYCCDCLWFAFTACDRPNDVGVHVTIVRPDAVACRCFEQRVK